MEPMKTVFAILAIALSCSLQANGKEHFPLEPNPELTPDSLCDFKLLIQIPLFSFKFFSKEL